ncbi:MAG: amidohydrolase [Bacteroidia bacterium]
MQVVAQEYLSVTIVQQNIVWQNTTANLQKLDELLSSVNQTDIMVLPEMFNVGFTMNAKEVSVYSNVTLDWMKEKSKSKNCAIVGSIPTEENGVFFNRLFWVEPNGKIVHYDKRHLFRMANEHEHYKSGTKKIIIHYKGWKICPLVCYDLRFPVWSRNKFTNGNYDYDLLIYVANWPQPRSNAWTILLQARAIENVSYCVGVNRVGEDGNGLNYLGDSAVYNFKGEKLSQLKTAIEDVETTQISKKELDFFREKFPVGLDADNFQLNTL